MTKEEAKHIGNGTKVCFMSDKVCTIEEHPVKNRFTGKVQYIEKIVRMPSGAGVPLEPYYDKFNLI